MLVFLLCVISFSKAKVYLGAGAVFLILWLATISDTRGFQGGMQTARGRIRSSVPDTILESVISTVAHCETPCNMSHPVVKCYPLLPKLNSCKFCIRVYFIGSFVCFSDYCKYF